MDFDDMKAKAGTEADKLEQEGEQKAKEQVKKEAPQYEQKAKTEGEEFAKKEEQDLTSRFQPFRWSPR